jgi:hypothetical protein
MKYKLSIEISIVLVCIMLMIPNGMASPGPPVWINQATLSTIDNNTSEDPENSGYGMIQVAVWQEWNGADWDIYMKYSLADGVLGSWVFPPVQPATTAGIDEINPAVAVSSVNQSTGATEIHVVYQEWRVPPGLPGQWDVMHTWTNNFGLGWSVPVPLDSTWNNDAIDPAIVYAEDLANPALGPGNILHFTWAEDIGVGIYGLYYNAYYLDVVPVPPVRAYLGATLIRVSPWGNCDVPEIASTDDILAGGVWDYDFAVVWQEPNNFGLLNIWYVAGTTIVFPGPPAMALTPGSLGQLNLPNAGNNYDPDIAATQDYLPIGLETYYFHVDYVFQVLGPPITYQIDTCYFAGLTPTPAAAAFIPTLPARGPLNTVLDRPTIASKLIALNPTVFETWMCWEDNVAGAGPDIWYRVGAYNVGAPPFAYFVPAARVPYVPPAGTSEFNPELWNRNDGTRMFPPMTHLVFDTSIGLAGNQEVEYIDP